MKNTARFRSFIQEMTQLVERHGAQLRAYVAAWAHLMGKPGARAGVYGIRRREMGWIDPVGPTGP